MRNRLFALPAAVALLTVPPALAGESVLPAPPRVAFITSGTFGSNLGGLAGADLICQEVALLAALDNPTGFVAFLSDTSTDAYCHVQGLTGTRAANCGQMSLPTDAGPWIRTDGAAFAARIDEALDPTGRVLRPLLDENGEPLNPFEGTWSATGEDGAFFYDEPGACGDWDGSAGFAAYGSTWATTLSWILDGTTSCAATTHLVCMETGPASPLPPHHEGGALAFVTSAHGVGDLSSWPERLGGSGAAAGDSICNYLASEAGLPYADSFVAWLSEGDTGAVDRLAYDGPWIRLDGVKVADGKTDLTDGLLHAPINLTETGEYLSNNGVWTGTTHDGEPTLTDCDGWTSAEGGATGSTGRANRAELAWTNHTQSPCNGDYLHLYCISVYPAVVFFDDLESGGVTAWSVTQP